MTKQEIRAEWVRRLREPERKQIQGYLGNPEGARCCLGVLCDMAVEAGVLPAPHVNSYNCMQYGSTFKVLPANVVDWIGLRDREGKYKGFGAPAPLLARDNDMGMSFPQIADIIEQNADTLFVEQS